MTTTAIIHYTCSPVIGGVEIVMEAHAKLLADHIVPGTVIAGRGEQFHQVIPVEIVPEMAAGHDWKTNFNETKNTIRARLDEALADVGVCFVHNVLTMHFNLALTAALAEIAAQGTVNIIGWTHDIAAINPWYADSIGREYPWSMMRTPLPGVRYVTNSAMRRRELSELFDMEASTIDVIPNGIDADRFTRMSDEGMALFERFGLFHNDIVLLYPARIVRRKNIELAIRITRALNDGGARARLLVTGAPDPHNANANEYYLFLKELAKKLRIDEQVMFLGEPEIAGGPDGGVSADLVSDLYQLSDLLLFPTKQEGFGIPILEAGAAGLSVACSRIEPLTEIAGNDVLYLDLDETPDAMARDIVSYLDDPDTEPLHERVMRSYTWPAIFEKHLMPLVGGSAG
ncbi:glycosyltransferase family 4 protein [Planctomycetota bacterium]